MPVAAMAAGSVISGAMNARAAGQAASAQANGLRQGSAALTEGRDQANAQMQPYATGGANAFSAQQALLGLGGDSAAQMAALQNSPGYQFRLGQGLKGVNSNAAARGMLQSGATMKGLNNYASDYASNEYDKRNNQLAGVANMGYNASNQIGSNYMNTADGLNKNFAGIGEARAGGINGRAQAISSGIQGLTSAFGARG